MIIAAATQHRQLSGEGFSTGAAAWTEFWQEQGPGSRCLARASPDWHRALNDHWQSLAAAFPPGARVLDIGCGAGAVARSLGEVRRDLTIIGIDFAEIPSGGDGTIEIWSGTHMEATPFPGASFGAAVSQFGYEYGQTEEAAKELARVLTPGAPFSFLVHHSESPILADSGAHAGALEGLSGSRLGTSFLSGDAAALDRELSSLRRKFPGESIMIDQAAHGLHRHVGTSELQRARIWKAVTDALAPGRVLEEALEKCCVAADEMDRWLAPLNAKFAIKPPSAIRLKGGQPIAWKIEGTRTRSR